LNQEIKEVNDLKVQCLNLDKFRCFIYHASFHTKNVYYIGVDHLTISKQRMTPLMEPNYSKKSYTMDNMILSQI